MMEYYIMQVGRETKYTETFRTLCTLPRSKQIQLKLDQIGEQFKWKNQGTSLGINKLEDSLILFKQ